MTWYKNFDAARADVYVAETLSNTNDGLYVGACLCPCCADAAHHDYFPIGE